MLPPTRPTLMPHIMRTNFVEGDINHVSPKANLPTLENNGWFLEEEIYIPLRCLSPPAPRAVLVLVKCGCQTSCRGNCSCAKNKLSCTIPCKCLVSVDNLLHVKQSIIILHTGLYPNLLWFHLLYRFMSSFTCRMG